MTDPGHKVVLSIMGVSREILPQICLDHRFVFAVLCLVKDNYKV